MWLFFLSSLVDENLFLKKKKIVNFFFFNTSYKLSFFTQRNKMLSYAKFNNLNSAGVKKCYTQTFIMFFTRYFLKRGFFLKIIAQLHWAASQLYTFVFQNIEKKKNKYENFFFLFNMIRFNQDLLNINTFFFWLLKNLSYNFYFKISVLPKFLRKKIKSQYLIEPSFIEKKKRMRAGLRIFSFNICTNSAYLLKYRLLNSFIDLAFNLKKSKVFLEKNMVYAKIFKLLKKKKKLG